MVGFDPQTNAMSAACGVLLSCAPKPAFCPQVHRGQLQSDTPASSSHCNCPNHAPGTPGIIGTQARAVQAFTTGSAKDSAGHYITRCLSCAAQVGQPASNSSAISTKTPQGTCRGVSIKALIVALAKDKRVAHVAEYLLRMVATPLCLASLAACDKLQLEVKQSLPVGALLRMGSQLCDALQLQVLPGSNIDVAVALSGPDLVRSALLNTLGAKTPKSISVPKFICKALLLGPGSGVHTKDAPKIKVSRNIRVPSCKDDGKDMFQPVPALSTLEFSPLLVEPPTRRCWRRPGAEPPDRAFYYSAILRVATALAPPLNQPNCPRKMRVTITFVESPGPAAVNFYPLCEERGEVCLLVAAGESMTWPLLSESLRRAAARGEIAGRTLHLKITGCIRSAFVGVPAKLPQAIVEAVSKTLGCADGEVQDFTAGACFLTLLSWADVSDAITVNVGDVHPETVGSGVHEWKQTLTTILAAVNRTTAETLFDIVKAAPAFSQSPPVDPTRTFSFVRTFSVKTHNILSSFSPMHERVAGSTLIGKGVKCEDLKDLSNSMTSLGKSHLLHKKRKRSGSTSPSPSAKGPWESIFFKKRLRVEVADKPALAPATEPNPMDAYANLFNLEEEEEDGEKGGRAA